MREGILLAGNMIMDVVKIIETYPEKMSLTPIYDIEYSIGGAVCNCGIDLARISPSLPITVLSAVGDDSFGHSIMDQMRVFSNINLDHVMYKGKTSFTDVMTEQNTGRRTFFTYKGADNLLIPEDFDFSVLPGDIIHIGYIMLLNGLDQTDSEYGTAMARVLCNAQKAGKKTSLDIVTEEGNRYKTLVPPALKYTDYCCLNESEAQSVTDVPLRDENGVLITRNFETACRVLKDMGVSTWAVIHSPDYSGGLDEKGIYHSYDSIPLPVGYVKGSVGAGDAFVAGVLYSAYEGKSLSDALWLGSAIAVISLSKPGATEAVTDMNTLVATYTAMEEKANC